MCEGDPYLIITELEDAVRTLARRPLEEERDRLRGLLRVDAVEVEYKREQATGEPRSAWLCGCCMTPSGDAQWCPSCLVEVGE